MIHQNSDSKTLFLGHDDNGILLNKSLQVLVTGANRRGGLEIPGFSHIPGQVDTLMRGEHQRLFESG